MSELQQAEVKAEEPVPEVKAEEVVPEVKVEEAAQEIEFKEETNVIDPPKAPEDPHDNDDLIVGGHHDMHEVPDISDEEVNLATEADGVEEHVAAYNERKASEEAAAAAEAAKKAEELRLAEEKNRKEHPEDYPEPKLEEIG